MISEQIKHTKDKTDTGLLVLKNVLKGRKKPMQIKELKEHVKEILQKGDAKPFEELCGMTLKDFILLHNCDFHVRQERKTLYVALVREKEHESHANRLELSIENGEMSGKSSISSNSSDDEEDWNEVTKKQTKPNKPKDKIHKPLAREIVSDHVEENAIIKKFKDLVAKQEDRDLMFVSGHVVYADNPEKCMQDIVCMWNTPQRTKSHIVIGVEKVEGVLQLNGAKKDFDVALYEPDRLFRTDLFTMRPTYNYSVIEYDLKMFGLIEIASSCGNGQPSIVKRACEKADVLLKENELWYRRGSCNVVCPPTDLTIGSIYQWFLGTIQTVMAPAEPMWDSVSIQVNDKDSNSDYTNDKYTEHKRNEPHTEPVSGVNMLEIGKDFTDFWDYVNGFKKGSFILLSGDVSNKQLNLANLSLVDWIAVYDFDVYSCSDGLFNAVQNPLEKRRHLRIGTWRDDPPYPTEDGTYWCFLRGRREISGSRTDSTDGLIESPQSWFKMTKSGLVNNCDQLAEFAEDYAVFTVVVLWPKKEQLVPFIKKYLDRLVEIVTHSPRIILCINEEPATEVGLIQFKALCHEYSGSIHVCKLDLSQLCLGIGNHIFEEKCNVFQYELPTANTCLSPIIPEKDAVWLREDLEILYLRNPYKKCSTDEKDFDEEIMKFYKGGTLHWFARYNNEGDSIDIERDGLKKLEENIQRNIENYKASVVTIAHAPGSGGTTLAQRALWKFHKRIPCAHARAGTFLKSQDLERKVSFLYEKTQLPVLLLIDGEDDTKVKYLCNTLKHTIIIHVKRFPWNMQKLGEKLQMDRVYLSGLVSANEANMLATKFGERCSSTKQKRLNKMRDDVKKKKTLHYMYEFGMTVYHHEFRGLVSYVKGYLQLEKNPTAELLPWQQCLGYLSLVYFYGQTSVPCQFFAPLFHKPSDYTMTLNEDFQYPITEFVVHDTQNKRKNTVRICHYEIAKEILEQVLSRNIKTHLKPRTDSLSANACRNLAPFCKGLIEYCSNKNTKHSVHCRTLQHILTKTFIHRDERDRGEDVEHDIRKKQQLSQLLLDVPASKPLFTERLQLLEKLSSSFPDDPNYHAHVGRFHAFCGPDDEKKAECCFRTAIKLCEKKNKGKQENELDDSMKSTLMHIYHMYGVVKKRRISSLIGKLKHDHTTTELLFNEKLRDLVETAEMASEYFTKSREMTPYVCDIFTHAFTSEIEVRLQICDYIVRQFKATAETGMIFKEFLDSSADDDSKVFVEISIQKIERLILECYMDVHLETEDQHSLKKLVKWYNTLFKKQVLPEESLFADDEIGKIRLQITSLKLQHGAQLLSIESVHDEGAFNAIIDLYEHMFQEIHSTGVGEKLGKKEIEYDYREWMFAIRQDICRKTYPIEEVLMHVQNWHHLVRSPMSTYYLFVLNSLLGFCIESKPGKTECLLRAFSLKAELRRKNGLIIRPKYPREWLGTSEDGIKILQTATRRIGLNENKEAGRGLMDLAVCKGTICHPNSRMYAGLIEIELNVDSAVHMFYIPKLVHLEGPRYAGQRVEFNLAFSVEHGYEAFNVKLLKRHGCSSCSATVEFRSVDESMPCTACEEMIHKDQLNEVKAEEYIDTHALEPEDVFYE